MEKIIKKAPSYTLEKGINERKEMSSALVVLMIFLSAILIFALLASPSWLEIRRNQISQAETAERAQESLRQAKARALIRAETEAEIQANSRKWQKQLGLATISNGEGVEHAFIRQLINDPSIMDGVKVKIGKKEYDLAYTASSVKRWAQTTAHLIAISAGYVDSKTNWQIGVKKSGDVAYILEVKNGEKLTVDIYTKEYDHISSVYAIKAEFNDKPLTSITGIGVDYQATFLADTKDGVGHYEYVWTPAKAVKQK